MNIGLTFSADKREKEGVIVFILQIKLFPLINSFRGFFLLTQKHVDDFRSKKRKILWKFYLSRIKLNIFIQKKGNN